MPLPNDALMDNMENVLMSEELNYDRNLLKIEHNALLFSLTSEQINIYNVVMDALNNSTDELFFVNGFGGSGKTYIWNTLTSRLCLNGSIVLAVASSGIASQLIPGGRTAHSRFVIPLHCNENSTCNIVQGSDLANLLIHTELIISDEAPMAHKVCFEALDKSLRNIMQIRDPKSLEKYYRSFQEDLNKT
ncbi:ATP-dependent DNA helicase PIF4-like [Senna tora]|uniref:ATP-dependent DNA helicase n=1 Tax=Senna tora TaxID=362788 RepID=A0A834WCU8_9FABA|nr:ATP-dependent DNA helicase PIF4-like [Senna tora]